MIICIPTNEVFDEIKMNSYYSGESRKLDEPGMFVVQASDDDFTGMQGFISTAVNDCCGFLQLIGRTTCSNSFAVIEYSIEERDYNLHIIPLLRKAIVDYIVYFTLYMWMGTVRPDLRSVFLEFCDKAVVDVKKYSSMMGRKPVRRRCTNLAGI